MVPKIAALLIAAVVVSGCGGSKKNTAAAPSAKGEEWVDMLSAKDKWHVFNKPGVWGPAWTLNGGVLQLNADKKENGKIVGGGDLVYDEVYSNFHLKLEWKIAPAGNSGIIFLSQEGAAFRHPYDTGPEMQVLDNAGHPDAKINKHRAGDLYDLVACSKETVKKAGEWNLAEIILKDGNLRFFLNGEEVVTTTLWDDNWNKLIAGSKFKTWESFAKFRSGKIVLQDHDDAVAYRNIMIRKL